MQCSATVATYYVFMKLMMPGFHIPHSKRFITSALVSGGVALNCIMLRCVSDILPLIETPLFLIIMQSNSSSLQSRWNLELNQNILYSVDQNGTPLSSTFLSQILWLSCSVGLQRILKVYLINWPLSVLLIWKRLMTLGMLEFWKMHCDIVVPSTGQNCSSTVIM